MKIIGIDIGITGAVAVLDGDGQLVDIHDMPVLKDGPAGRRTINATLLAGIISGTHKWIRLSSNMWLRGPERGPQGPLLSAGAVGLSKASSAH